MKTQILHLEPHDDVVSARDKMGWGQTPRILLVLPEKRRILDRQLDLVLLLRHSRAQRAQLALVTVDPEVTFNAHELGIPTFHDIEQAQSRRWRRARRGRLRPAVGSLPEAEARPAAASESLRSLKEELRTTGARWDDQPSVRLLIFAAGALAVLILAGVLAPNAKIVLPPAVDAQSTSFTAEASVKVEQFGITGALPAHELKLVVEGRDTVATTGSQTVPGQPATGTILLTNLTDQALTVPAGTVVLTLEEPIVRFETTRVARLAAGSGQQATVPVEALTRGESGNVPAGSLRAVEGALGLRLTVTNSAGMRGGTDFIGAAASLNDRRELRNRLTAALQDTAAQEFRGMLAPGDVVLTGVPRLLSVVEEVFEPGEDAPAERLSLLLRLEYSTLIVRGTDLERLATALLDANLPPGYTAEPGSVKLAHETAPILIGGEAARWQVRAERSITARLSASEAAYLSLGLPAARASDRLEGALPLAGPPEIAIWPAWWPRVPVLPFRISVETR